MDVILIPLFVILSSLIGIYIWIVIASAALHWLINFNVINYNNNFVRMIRELLYRFTDPILGGIRRFLPPAGGFDFSPFLLILALWFLQGVLGRLLLKLVVGGSV